MPEIEPEDDVRYDLAGNALPSAPRPTAAPMLAAGEPPNPPPSPIRANFSRSAPPGLPFATLPTSWPESAGPVWTPPPGYVPPVGFEKKPKAAHKAALGGTTLYAVLGVMALGVVALVFALHSVKPRMVATPKTYKTYTALDETFVCDQPVGWAMKDFGEVGGPNSGVTFSSGRASVKVDSSIVESLIARMTTSTPPPLPPVQTLHDTDEAKYKTALPHYKEKTAEPFNSKFGDALVSEWTSSEGDFHLHGYRMTTESQARKITVFCQCPQRDWPALEPAFQHIITSVAPGSQ